MSFNVHPIVNIEKFPNVPCNECNLCCRISGRELELDLEDLGRYKEYEKDGKMYLAKKDNDECVYFDGKCMIYEDRPVSCRRFDCRNFISNPNLPEEIRVQAKKRTVR